VQERPNDAGAAAQLFPYTAEAVRTRTTSPIAGREPHGPILSDPAARAELERYFDRIEQHLPTWLARFLHWLRQPQMLAVRIFVCVLLIAGGILSFLPILGFWMLPLGLMIIAQDLPLLQPPLVRLFRWTERKWENWQRGSSR
jgi:hypothetical protein